MPASKPRNATLAVRRSADTSKGGASSAHGGDGRGSAEPASGVVVSVLAAAHALMFVFAFPPFDLWPLVFIAPAPLAWLAIHSKSMRRATCVVLVAQCLMWLWIDRWLIDVTIAGYPMKAIYMALFAWFFVWLIRRISSHPKTSHLPMTLVIPIVWVGLECLRGELLFDGYSWFLLAHPAIQWPALAQSADLLGTYFVSFIVATTAGAVVDVARLRTGSISPKIAISALLAVAAVQLTNVGYGVWRLGQGTALRPGPKVLLIQTNLPQSNKIGWSPEAQRQDVASFVELTRRAAEEFGGDFDLIVWPETMLPVRGLEQETLRTLLTWGQTDQLQFAHEVFELRDQLATPMLVGTPCFVDLDVDQSEDPPRFVWSRHYNSAYLIADNGELQRYDKHLLTPFGEVMPYISKWPWLEDKLLGIGASGMSFDLDANEDIARLLLRFDDRELRLATPICFEDAAARVCRRMIYEGGTKRAEVLVNLSNDGWFGSHDDGRAQHAQAARFRCIENRVPMVRCANTGFSLHFDPCGRLIDRIGVEGYGQARHPGWLLARTSLDSRSTLYGRVGEIWPWICLVLTALATGRTMIKVNEG